MAESESEQLLDEIGELLTEDGDYSSEPTLLYAQVERNTTGQSIFK